MTEKCSVEQRVLAARTAEAVPCPYCYQDQNLACVTRPQNGRQNVAAFTHMERVHARLSQITKHALLARTKGAR